MEASIVHCSPADNPGTDVKLLLGIHKGTCPARTSNESWVRKIPISGLYMGGCSSLSSPKPPMLSTDGMSRHRLMPYEPTIIHDNC